MELNKGSYYGLWWLIGNERQPINGTLHFDHEGKSILYTLDHFEPIGKPNINSFSKYECIIGIGSSMENGKDYSFKLIDVYQTRRSTQVFQKNRYSAQLTLIGSVDTNDNSNRFNYLMLSNPSLEKWVELTGFKNNDARIKQNEFGFTYNYTQPAAIKLFENEKLEIYFFFRANINYRSRREILLSEAPFINIKYKIEIDITTAQQMKTNIERLFSILWQEPTFFNVFELKSIAGNDFRIFGAEVSEIFSNRKAFSFNDFIAKAGIILKNWLSLNEELNLLINTFFTAFSSKKMILEDKFLSYCFSLEVYHRIRIKSKESLKKSNETMYQKVMNEIKSGDASTWLKNILNKDLDIRFSIRLKNLFEHSLIKHNFNNLDEFVSKIVKTRNYHVHLDHTLENAIFKIEELINVNQILSTLMIELLNKELYAGKSN